jgi:hypothetical protein
MKSFTIVMILLGTISLVSANSAKTVHLGEISDTQCAMNVHSLSRSHAEMIAKSTIGTDAASCASACVKRGGEWVLKSGNDVYRLKNQAGIEEFAGQKVQITGTLDSKTSTIDNSAIALTPSTRHGTH